MAKVTPYLTQIEYSDQQKKEIALKNTILMLNDRNILDNDSVKPDIDTFVSNKNEEDVYIVRQNNGNRNNIYIKFLNQKITSINKSSDIGIFLQTYKKDKKIVLVFAINNKVKQYVCENYPNTEIFTIGEISNRIVDANIMSTHILLSEEESNSVLEEYGAKKRNMPLILHTDPVARHYNMPIGRICKIIRPSTVGGEAPSYRLVV